MRELVKAISERVFPVGRLDYHTSGALLLTNDGEFCDALIHPKRDVPKTYVVKVQGEMKEADRLRWEEGVTIDGEKTRAAEVFVLRHEPGKTWVEVTLYEGRNQQIRKMGEATGFPVMRLARTAFAGDQHRRASAGRIPVSFSRRARCAARAIRRAAALAQTRWPAGDQRCSRSRASRAPAERGANAATRDARAAGNESRPVRPARAGPALDRSSSPLYAKERRLIRHGRRFESGDAARKSRC